MPASSKKQRKQKKSGLLKSVADTVGNMSAAELAGATGLTILGGVGLATLVRSPQTLETDVDEITRALENDNTPDTVALIDMRAKTQLHMRHAHGAIKVAKERGDAVAVIKLEAIAEKAEHNAKRIAELQGDVTYNNNVPLRAARRRVIAKRADVKAKRAQLRIARAKQKRDAKLEERLAAAIAAAEAEVGAAKEKLDAIAPIEFVGYTRRHMQSAGLRLRARLGVDEPSNEEWHMVAEAYAAADNPVAAVKLAQMADAAHAQKEQGDAVAGAEDNGGAGVATMRSRLNKWLRKSDAEGGAEDPDGEDAPGEGGDDDAGVEGGDPDGGDDGGFGSSARRAQSGDTSEEKEQEGEARPPINA